MTTNAIDFDQIAHAVATDPAVARAEARITQARSRIEKYSELIAQQTEGTVEGAVPAEISGPFSHAERELATAKRTAFAKFRPDLVEQQRRLIDEIVAVWETLDQKFAALRDHERTCNQLAPERGQRLSEHHLVDHADGTRRESWARQARPVTPSSSATPSIRERLTQMIAAGMRDEEDRRVSAG